jgi:hypothetical protein
VNPETGGLEGCFFAFTCDVPDPNGDLRAETLDAFGNVDAFAACRAVERQTCTLLRGSDTRRTLCSHGRDPAEAHVGPRRLEEALGLTRCLPRDPFLLQPPEPLSPARVAASRVPAGHMDHAGPLQLRARAQSWVPTRSLPRSLRTGRCRSVGNMAPACGRRWTARRTTDSSSISHPHHWTLFQRPNNELLPRGLQLVKDEDPPAGTLLYAMTVYDETHPNAFKTGEFGGGTGGGDNDGGGGGDDKKKKKKKPPPTPSREASQTARIETATPQGPPRSKRKAPEARAEEHASGPRGLPRQKHKQPAKGKQEKVGTTASAIIAGVAPTGSALRGEWDSALQAAIAGSRSNFLRLQQLIGQLRSGLPAGQPAHGLLLRNGWTPLPTGASCRPITSSWSCAARSFSRRPFR